MKKEIAVGICFCLAGVLAAWLFGYEYFSTYGFLNEYHMQTFAKAEFDTPALLGNILWERGKMFLIIVIISCTPLKKITPLFLRCGICFTAGMFLAACMMNMGWKGLLFFTVSWLPHGFLYLLVLVLVCKMNLYQVYGRKNAALKLTVIYMGTVILFLLGCVTEATIGVSLLRRITSILV